MRDLQITASITNRESASVEAYLNEIGKVPLIGAEEEAQLARQIRNGDQAALDRLLKVNLRFVVSVAKKYQNHGLPLGDLISEGNLGLLKAARKFDETRGFKFISYAVWWIRQAMLEAIAQQARMIRLPNNQVGMITQMNKAAARLEQVVERQPTAEEIADFMQKDVARVKDAAAAAPRTASYDAPLSQCEDEYSLLDRIHSGDAMTDHLLLQANRETAMDRLLRTLPDRERQIIELSYGLNGERELDHVEIGERIGLSPERVRQLRKIALDKLKRCPGLPELLAN